MLPLLGRGKIGAHVELFKDDERTGERVLVHTSRPCEDCGFPLVGAVVPTATGQKHVRCPEGVAHGS